MNFLGSSVLDMSRGSVELHETQFFLVRPKQKNSNTCIPISSQFSSLTFRPDSSRMAAKSGGFGLDLYIFHESDLDLRFLRRWI